LTGSRMAGAGQTEPGWKTMAYKSKSGLLSRGSVCCEWGTQEGAG